MNFEKLSELFLYQPEQPLLFNSGTFLLLFTLLLLFYSAIYRNPRSRIIYILLFSLYFYYKSSGWYLFILLGSVIVDYVISVNLHTMKGGRARKILFITSIVVNLGLLFYFKYTNFFLANFYDLLDEPFKALDIFLPIGISFYTFQSLSYIIDIYKRELRPAQSFLDYAFYMTFFPHLVAGPIVRARFFLPQVRTDVLVNESNTWKGMFLIGRGLVKKAIIADYLAQYNDLVFSNPAGYSGLEVLLGIYGYTMQIYCDFSGYSDMAIGIARILGYNLGENFNNPYRSLSLSEFWRRWHISLSGWMRDYIYIPLGGSKHGRLRKYMNLFVTMLISGFWHGASWTFVIWGALHGLGLLITNIFQDMKWASFIKIPNAVKWFVTFHIVALLWVFFRADSMHTAGLVIEKAMSFSGIDHVWVMLRDRYQVVIFVGLVLIFNIAGGKLEEKIADRFEQFHFAFKAALFLLLLQLVIQYQSAAVKPFIYFQF
jgi:alginate O-acetyltransferase complex protein AlgI